MKDQKGYEQQSKLDCTNHDILCNLFLSSGKAEIQKSIEIVGLEKSMAALLVALQKDMDVIKNMKKT